jgi:hypothetical protein
MIVYFELGNDIVNGIVAAGCIECGERIFRKEIDEFAVGERVLFPKVWVLVSKKCETVSSRG